MATVSDPHSDQPRKAAANFQWCIATLVGITLLSLLAVHAPPRIKLLGLFPIAVGLVAGYGLGRLAKSLAMPPSRRLMANVCLLIVVGQVGMTMEAHRVWKKREWDAFEKSPTGRMALNHVDDEDAPAELKAGFRSTIDTQRESISFQSYLARRVMAMGDWNQPWPLVFWIGETALATAAGCWIFRQQDRTRSDA